MRRRLGHANLLEVRADLWRVPLALSVAALLLFGTTVWIDARVARGELALPHWLSIGGVDDARAILSAMLGAVSTVLALIFSVALLVLSMAVSQFGPRILYRFVRNGLTQVTIGLFFATFVHTVLTFVVTRQDATHHFVPQLTLVMNVALVITSFVLLVFFSHRTAVSIQTQNVVAQIVADVHTALAERQATARLFAAPAHTHETMAAADALVARCATEGATVRATRTGFVQEVDLAGLLDAADRADAAVRLLHRPGQFVLQHAPLCEVVPGNRAGELTPAVHRTVGIGTHRTLKQDFEFGLAQLVEIALRALSPAVNDTFTGLTCVDWLGDAIRTIYTSPAPGGVLLGATGAVRLVWSPPRFERLVKGAFDHIRQAGADNPAVLIRLLQTFARLAAQVRDEAFRAPLLVQVEAIREGASGERLVTADRADVDAAYRAAREALGTG